MTALAGILPGLLFQAHKTGWLTISDGPLSGRALLASRRVVGAMVEWQRRRGPKASDCGRCQMNCGGLMAVNTSVLARAEARAAAGDEPSWAVPTGRSTERTRA
jgi:hypothetical protein